MWTSLERWAVRIVGLATFVFLARLLKPAEFGLAALASTLSGILGALAEGGITSYVVQARDVDDEALSTTFWVALALSSSAAVVLAVLAPVMASLLHSPRLTGLTLGMAPSLIGIGISTVPQGLLQRELRFRQLAGRQLAGVTVSGVVGISLAAVGAGAWAIVAQTVTAVWVGAVILWIRSDWRPTFYWSAEQARDTFRFSWKLLGANLLVTFRDQGQNLMVGAFLGTVPLGYWSVATRILTIVLDLGSNGVQAVVMPAFVKLRGNRARLVAAYSRATTAAAMGTLPLLTVSSALAPALVPFLFGQRWHDAGPLTAILTLSGIFNIIVNFDQAMYLGLGRPGVELRLVTAIVLFQLVVVAAFAHFGLIPLAIAFAIRGGLTWPLRSYVLRRTFGIKWSDYKGLIPVCVASFAAMLPAWAAREYLSVDRFLQILVGGAAAFFLYLVMLQLLSSDFRGYARLLPGVLARLRGATRTQPGGI